MRQGAPATGSAEAAYFTGRVRCVLPLLIQPHQNNRQQNHKGLTNRRVMH
jgi:hypothetical protein